MPSITEVDNIKSLDDSGQTDILTKTGTGGSKVFTADNVTLGSSVVFPAGHVTKAWTFSDAASGPMATTGTVKTIGSAPFSFPAISGRKYIISGNQRTDVRRAAGDLTQRWGRFYLFYGTTSRAFDSTTGPDVDTELLNHDVGRLLVAASEIHAAGYGVFNYNTFFTAGSTATHYFYTAGASYYAGNIQVTLTCGATFPHFAHVLEVMP